MGFPWRGLVFPLGGGPSPDGACKKGGTVAKTQAPLTLATESWEAWTKSGGKGAQSQPQTISLQNVLEKKLDEKTQMFHDYRDKLADPRFFSPIKT